MTVQRSFIPSFGTAVAGYGQSTDDAVAQQQMYHIAAEGEDVDGAQVTDTGGSQAIVPTNGAAPTTIVKPEAQLRAQVVQLEASLKRWKAAFGVACGVGGVTTAAAAAIGYYVGKRKSRHLADFDDDGIGDTGDMDDMADLDDLGEPEGKRR